MENHHRNNKKHHLNAARRAEKVASVSASPAPPGHARKVASRDVNRSLQRTQSNGESRRSDSRTDHRQHDKPRHSSQYRSGDRAPETIGRAPQRSDPVRPVKAKFKLRAAALTSLLSRVKRRSRRTLSSVRCVQYVTI